MQNRSIIYLRKNKARKILEAPLQADLRTFLSATYAITRSNIVRRHIGATLDMLVQPSYRMSA